MKKLLLGFLLVISIAFVAFPIWFENLSSDACMEFDVGIAICAASDMAKLSNHGRVPLEHESLAIKKGALRLDAARNETVAFQLIIQNRIGNISDSISFQMVDLVSDLYKLDAREFTSFYQAWYHYVNKGGYSWGPKSAVLKWPEYYPDTLIPQYSECSHPDDPLYLDVKVPAKRNGLQAMWVDIYIPKNQPEGLYKSNIIATLSSGQVLEIPLELTIWSATLPDKPTFDAVGEVYRTYKLEGAGEDVSTLAWKKMSHCYQKMAHKHRMVFIERSGNIDEGDGWSRYDSVFDPVLSGSLFTSENNYTGPGVNIPVSVWRTPWAQDFDVELKKPLTQDQLKRYRNLASEWSQHVKEKNWDDTDYFAYIFDEIDGPTDNPVLTSKRRDYLEMTHLQMKNVQNALDSGSGDKSIDLLWTSHSDPVQWSGIDGLDLSDIVRLWAPNAHAASPGFLGLQKKQGDKIWFYHSGHPSVGVHSINASGIEMRTWGVIGARYQFDGQLMWAINLGNDDQPFAIPSYKDDDDRFGNGVMVYPGNQLPKIGFSARPGPIPSMRLKTWRQGLQDAELTTLASNNGHGSEVAALLHEMIPVALAEATESAAQWSTNTSSWINFHRKLLRLASD